MGLTAERMPAVFQDCWAVRQWHGQNTSLAYLSNYETETLAFSERGVQSLWVVWRESQRILTSLRLHEGERNFNL